MDGTLGGTVLFKALVRWDTGCSGIAGCGTITLGACGLSMLTGFSTLGTGGYTLGDRRPSHFSFFLGWGAVSSLGLFSTAQSLSVSCRD